MSSILSLALFTMLTLAVTSVQAVDRALRETGITGQSNAPIRDDFNGEDEIYTLKHHGPIPEFFQTLPNEYGDDLYNVRFNSPIEPFYIVGVYLALFDLNIFDEDNERKAGPAGTPAVKISVWDSGDQDDSTGFPTDRIAARDFPYISAQRDTLKLSKASSVTWNFLDLRPLNIHFQDRLPFHIAVSSISDQPTDTVALFTDNGVGQNSTDYSGFWNSQDSIWVKWRYTPGIRRGLNFFLMVVISDTPNDSTNFPPISVKMDEVQPNSILLDPAYPNPFNNRTSLRFSIPDASPYRVQLFDQMGRQVQLLGEGVGGSGVLALDAASLSSGTYFVIMTTSKGVLTQPIHLVR